VTGLTLRGIFLLRKKEIDWFYEGGASAIFPDAWELYRDFIPEDERDDFVKAYSKRLNSTDESVQISAAKAWTNWEMATSYLVPNEDSLRRGENDQFALV
jgi:proline iminopeptidase